jgi:hypothetical protein
MPMQRFVFLGLPVVTLLLAGCRTTEPTASIAAPAVANSLSAPDGVYPLPPVTSEMLPGTPSLAAGQPAVAPASCEPAEPKKAWWKGWLPTRDQNDPTRERGQFKDGWYEPEYRGISD